MNIDKGNRKTWVYALSSALGLLVFIILALLCYVNKTPEPGFASWSTFQITITGFYMGANYGEHMAQKK